MRYFSAIDYGKGRAVEGGEEAWQKAATNVQKTLEKDGVTKRANST
jgi:hypothetical protein